MTQTTTNSSSSLTTKQKLDIISLSNRLISIKDTSFAGLVLWVEPKIVEQDVFAYTDGISIYYGNQYFENDSLLERTAVTIHEVLHVAFRHVQRIKTRNPRLWNICTDCIINNAITNINWVTLPKDVVTFESLLEPRVLNEFPVSYWTSERLYDYLLNKAKSNQNQDSNDNNDGEGSFLDREIDKLVDKLHSQFPTLWKDIDKNSNSNNESEIEDQQWDNRVQRAIAQGTKSNNILRDLYKDFPKSETPWQRILQRYMTKACLPRTDNNWQRPGRHMLGSRNRIFQPGIKQVKGIDRCVIIVDTSGSINDNILSSFAGEIEAIQKQTNATIELLFADTTIRSRYTIKAHGSSFSRQMKQGLIKAKGGGGTSFTAPLNEAKLLKSPLVIYLTDGYGDFGNSSNYRGMNILWAIFTDVIAPYGHTLSIKL